MSRLAVVPNNLRPSECCLCAAKESTDTDVIELHFDGLEVCKKQRGKGAASMEVVNRKFVIFGAQVWLEC